MIDSARPPSLDSLASDSSTLKGVDLALQVEKPRVPLTSLALKNLGPTRTNLGHTTPVFHWLAEAWVFHTCFIVGLSYILTFVVPQGYTDTELWNNSCWVKIFWLVPIPYTLICFFGLALPLRTPKFVKRDPYSARRVDNLYILTVTKGDNKDAVKRAWEAHRHLEALDPCIRVHVLTDEPNYFDNINCYTCPKSFKTSNSKYKARALEWYRQTMKYTEFDWILHLDEESVIDDASVLRCLDFVKYQKEYQWGQGVILYNQYRYWTNWIYTVADAIRVSDDLARFHLQYTYFHRPVFGAHGSFLLTNGMVENAVTWDLGSLTEDFQFAVHAWEKGYKCGPIAGFVREQSPMDFIGFMKQRRRWYVGIRRLPLFLPKVWAGFWTIGILSLAATFASLLMQIWVHENTPRWIGVLKDFCKHRWLTLAFSTFVYLYLLGIFVQDLDKGVNPIIIILRLPTTFLLQFVGSVMEAMAVCYGIIFPPADFDVIKK
ncbi:hypothetical protein HDU91_000496 [Kappamyces sp. JEL0680]|nr:hypothetical protein HDU91_000496 [Kappamyces sp. JEL0680]